MRNDIKELLDSVVAAGNKSSYYADDILDACAPALKAITNSVVTDEVLFSFLSGTKKEHPSSSKIALTLLKDKKYERKTANALIEGNRHLSLRKYLKDTAQQETEAQYAFKYALEQKSEEILMMLGTDFSKYFDFEARATIFDQSYAAQRSEDYTEKLKEEIIEKYPTAESLAERISKTETGAFRRLLQSVQESENLDRHWKFHTDKPEEASVRSYFDNISITRVFNFNAETVTIVTSKDKAVSAETKFFNEFNSQAEIEIARENLRLFHGRSPNNSEKSGEKQKMKIAPKILGGKNV